MQCMFDDRMVTRGSMEIATQKELVPIMATQIQGIPSAQELMVYQTWAKNAADSQMYRGIGKESAIMMIMLAAREYGIGPAQALNGGLHIIEGKVELSARLMSALIRRAKHRLKIVESNEKVCTIEGTRSDTGESHTVTFTIEMAQKAGLIKDKGGWRKTPEDMLYARCVSRLARQLFSDVVGIGYVEGEIIDCRANGEVLEVFPETNTEPHDQYIIVDELYSKFDKEDQKIFKRAEKLYNFMTQPFSVSEVFTGKKGEYVKLEDNLIGCERILRGDYDHMEPQDFYMIGRGPKV